jgi:hypothetical protein
VTTTAAALREAVKPGMALPSVLRGVSYDLGFRIFEFEYSTRENGRLLCDVRADLSLARRYGISMQELPLICRSFLDRQDKSVRMRSLTLTEAEMQVLAEERMIRDAERKNRSGRR